MKRLRFLIFIWLTLGLLSLSLASCSPTGTPVPITSPTAQPEASQDSSDLNITTPTPRPTVAPGAVTNLVDKVTEAVGVENTQILGLTTQDWINLIISVLLVLFGFLMAGRLALRLLHVLEKRLSGKVDEYIMGRIEPQIKWLIVSLISQFAINRLVFIRAEVKSSLSNVFFIIYLVIILSGLWTLVDLGIDTYIDTYVKAANQDKDAERLEPLAPLLHRVAHIVFLILGAQVLFGRFGVELGAVFTAIGISGLAISLAAQDVLSDFIAGIIILVSQPFRVGDRIEIQSLGTWGDVAEIGVRTTNIRTRDNRMVIVPNSVIGKSSVINYTYPDPQYRVQIDIGIAYGTDIEKARRIIIETVRNIEGVVKDKPVDALYNSMGDSAMIFRVRWWIESYTDKRRTFDRVNTALQNALDAAGIDMPFPTQELNVKIESDSSKDSS